MTRKRTESASPEGPKARKTGPKSPGLTGSGGALRFPANRGAPLGSAYPRGKAMKIRNSLKTLRGRHRNNRLVRRKGRIYIINKTNPRFKARQG